MIKQIALVHLTFIVAFIALYNLAYDNIINLRTVFFSSITEKSVDFYNDENFIYEEKSFINEYKDEMLTILSDLEITKDDNSIDKAKKITLSFSKNGGYPIHSIDLKKKINKLSQSKGWCSDHSEAFIAVSHLFGLKTREVHNSYHTFNEFYSDEYKKWIWIDSQFALMAYEKNIPLNLLEIKKLYDLDKKLEWKCFGDSNFYLFDHKVSSLVYYDEKEDFEVLMLTNGNNVFENDIENKKLSLFHKTIRQLILLTKGIQPEYKIFHTYKGEKLKLLETTKIIANLILVLWLISNIWIFILKLKDK